MPRTCHLAHYHCHTGMPASVGAKRDAEMRLGFLQTWLNTTLDRVLIWIWFWKASSGGQWGCWLNTTHTHRIYLVQYLSYLCDNLQFVFLRAPLGAGILCFTGADRKCVNAWEKLNKSRLFKIPLLCFGGWFWVWVVMAGRWYVCLWQTYHNSDKRFFNFFHSSFLWKKNLMPLPWVWAVRAGWWRGAPCLVPRRRNSVVGRTPARPHAPVGP